LLKLSTWQKGGEQMKLDATKETLPEAGTTKGN
jgi:hypothetical protein